MPCFSSQVDLTNVVVRAPSASGYSHRHPIKWHAFEIGWPTRDCRSRRLPWFLPSSERHRSSPPPKLAGSASGGRTRCGCHLSVNDLWWASQVTSTQQMHHQARRTFGHDHTCLCARPLASNKLVPLARRSVLPSAAAMCSQARGGDS